jgi:hypothetical protein
MFLFTVEEHQILAEMIDYHHQMNNDCLSFDRSYEFEHVSKEQNL